MGIVDFSVLRGKRILVTGHTGFKGGWLALWLEMMGAELGGLALDPEYDYGIFTLSRIGERIDDYRVDIRDLEQVETAFASFRPEIVFHLAAQPLVLESYRRPVDTFSTNTLGTAHVLEAVRHTPSVRAAVIVTSDKCYENRESPHCYKETDPMGGFDPYSSSKGAAELIIASYRRSFFSRPGAPGIASVRAGNVIGGGDWSSDRLLPDIMRAIDARRIIEIRNPSATRPWQHVLDPLRGYLTLACKLLHHPGEFSEAWNFGPLPNQVFPVRKVVQDVLNRFGRGSWCDVSDPNQPHESRLLSLDISKSVQRLGWSPVLTYEEIIDLTADWYATYRERDALDLCREQITTYLELWKSRNTG